MNREYNCKVSSKNPKRLLKNLQNTIGDYFFCRTLYVHCSVVHMAKYEYQKSAK